MTRSLQPIIDYCMSCTGAVQDFPFGDGVMVFKVGGKMFALLNLQEPFRINLKCDAVYALHLRQNYPQVKPGYHMNKKHWNTVELDGGITMELLHEWISDSYQLVLKNLPQKERQRLLG